MTQPNADKEYEIKYSITQRTTGDPQKVIQAFHDEIKLQFNSSVSLDWVQARNLKTKQYHVVENPKLTYQEKRDEGVVDPEGAVGGA